jgi:4-amino-4-deoxy-L-arabinose transferase-like glycosyltransferase
MLNDIRQEILGHKIIYILLAIILFGALFVRVYRIDQILQFYFDQGRDGLAVWDLVYNHKVSLIGPTTGIAGIFRGPFYYWLITPPYIIGRGDPIYPSIFLSLTTVVAISFLYYLGKKILSREAGLIAAILASFSFYLMHASRWLSNPTPMLLLSMLLVWMMILVTEGKRWAWVGIALLAGASQFHFGSSGEFFYFPAIAIFFVWMFITNKKSRPSVKITIISILAFLFTASPLIIFDLRHNQILSKNILEFLFAKESFKTDFMKVLGDRYGLYRGAFLTNIFLDLSGIGGALLLSLLAGFLAFLPKLVKNKSFMILVLLLGTVVVGMLFFQGNEGNVYTYYLTGYYFIFVLFVGVILGKFWQHNLGKIFVAIFIYFFLVQNYLPIKSFITAGVDGPTTIAYGNQKQALEWMYKDAAGEEFNVDSYVPPVIPHAYDYLLKWSAPDNFEPVDRKSLLYTLYEEDPPHPERLEAWMARQKGIGIILYEEKFGGITVQRRARIPGGE